MSKEKGKTQNKKRKLTRQEKKQIDALIRQSKGDGKPHTAQDSIPFERMYKDGICRLANGRYSKCIEFEDINYQLAQPDDKTAIFEALCDMYNSFDASISVQLSLISRHANKEDFKSSITIAPQNDDFDSIRAEYTEMLQTQLERGNNGLIKTKFLTFTIEAKDIKSARARLARIETDTLNHFKVIGAAARVLDGKQRLEVLHGLFHPDGERFNFAWEWLPVSGLSVKDFIAPSSFRFGDGRMFQMGGKFGAVSFLQIAAPELSDRKFCNHYAPCREVWQRGEKVNRYIGYDAGEVKRYEHSRKYNEADKKYHNRYPLIEEWGWNRDDCIREIKAAGLPQPGKSSCFFCPSMKKQEILYLKEHYPDLFNRAATLEENAMPYLKTVKGLGRSYSWKEQFGKE